MISLWSEYYDPFRELDELRRQMNDVFGQLRPPRTGRRAASDWPVVSVFDEGQALTFRAEVPGMAEDQLEVEANEQSLTIRGKRMTEKPEGYTVHRRERGDVEFARAFQLPCKVDPEKVSAKLNDGVLVISLAKRPEEHPRTVTVKVG